MITKLTSVKTLIAKLIADLDIQSDDLRISDIRSWIGEAIEKIGAAHQLQKKVSGADGTPIAILSGYQCPLPCDLHQLHQVAYSINCDGPWLPMRKATGSFAVWGNDDCCCDKCVGYTEGHVGHCCDKHGTQCGCNPEMIVQDDIMTRIVVDMYGNLDKTQALELINSNENTKKVVSALLNCCTINNHFPDGATCSNPSRDLQYTVKPGWIMCNIPCGYLKLSYDAVPTDEDGYPLIPDMTSFMEAIYWYVTMKMKYPEYLNGKLNREVYYDIKRSWNFYRKQAYAEALMPNEDSLESIKNTWNKLYPEMNDHSTFYSHSGERQIIYGTLR